MPISRELEGNFGLCLRLFLQAFSVTFFVFLDWILFELLDVIARHSRVDFLQKGVHNFNITVNGSGFLANLIRSPFEGFDIHEHVKVVISNEPCLPHPSIFKPWKIIRIYLLFLLYLYLIQNQVFIHRSKRYVCAYFYPKREKTRVLYLYNKILKRRKDVFKAMGQMVKEKLKVYGGVKQRKNFLQVIYVAMQVGGGTLEARQGWLTVKVTLKFQLPECSPLP